MLHFIRHGETDYNVEGRLAGGDVEARLTDAGRAQAQRLGTDNRAVLRTCDLLVVSPQTRAQETASLIRPFCAPHVALETAEGLREWILGSWSGKAYGAVPSLFSEPPPDPEQGERFALFEGRVLDTLHRLALRPEKSILVVSHGAVWFAYARRFEPDAMPIGNCVRRGMDRAALAALTCGGHEKEPRPEPGLLR